MVFLYDELGWAGLLFSPGFELLLVPGDYRHLTKMVQESSSNTATPAATATAAFGPALASHAAALCMVGSARYASECLCSCHLRPLYSTLATCFNVYHNCGVVHFCGATIFSRAHLRCIWRRSRSGSIS